MLLPPSTTDWCWFGKQTPAEIAATASQNSAQDIHWFQNAYAWLYQRLKPEVRNKLSPPNSKTPVGPPPYWHPILAAGGNHGALGFLSVDSPPKFGPALATGTNDELRNHAYNAAKYVFDLFRSLDHDLGDPAVEIHLPDGDGTSLSLPAIMAAMSRILGISWSDDVVATGCFDANDKTLKPVAADTLPQKIEIARRYGYKKLILVEGQTVPENVDMEIVSVNTDPLLAMFDLLQIAENTDDSEQRAARLLAVFAEKKMRKMRFSDMESVVSRFCSSSSRLVRHVACDILSRAALHEGNTETSYQYHKKADMLDWTEIPTDWLGHYIRYEATASHAILAVDCGLWDRWYHCHHVVKTKLCILKTAVFHRCADANDILALLKLSNTRGLRKHFRARLQQSKHILRCAWDDFFYLFAEWDKLFPYCKQHGIEDTSFERHRNYSVSVLADACKLGNSLMPYGGADYMLSLIAEREFVRTNGFDRAAWFDWNFVVKTTPTEADIDKILAESDVEYAKSKDYPNFLVYEKLLRYGYGTENQRSHAVSQLAVAGHLSPDLATTSILTLLALRTRQVLAQHGRIQDTEPVLPPENSPLRTIADELLSDKRTLIDRAPY